MHREYADEPHRRRHTDAPGWRDRAAEVDERRRRIEGLADEPRTRDARRDDDEDDIVVPRRSREHAERERARPWPDEDRRPEERRESRWAEGRDDDRREWMGREYRESDAPRRRSDAERARRFDEDVSDERVARWRGSVDPRAYEGPDPYERLRDEGHDDRREGRSGTARPGQRPGARSGLNPDRPYLSHYTERPWPPDDRGYATRQGDRVYADGSRRREHHGNGHGEPDRRREPDEAQRRGDFTGRGPRSWQRSDDRIRDEVCEVLTEHPRIDATDVTVSVAHGEVRLEGTVPTRAMRREAEACLDDLPGVRDVRNDLRVDNPAEQAGATVRPG